MSPPSSPPDSPWNRLRQWTPARIALGASGGSVPTIAALDFRMAHASARDAVQRPFDAAKLVKRIEALGLACRALRSGVTDRATYLRRPDLGRLLDEDSRTTLETLGTAEGPFDLVIVCSDGLSAVAAEAQIVPLLEALVPRLDGWKLAPVLVVPFARVALMDDAGERLKAKLALILLGERPGLGSADSLGAYFVHDPRVGRTDGERNCLSNIRASGLAPAVAAETLARLLAESRRLGISGVGLKDMTALGSAFETKSLSG